MLYYLFEYLEHQYQLPGAGLFQFLTFRAALAGTISIVLTLALEKRVIRAIKFPDQRVGTWLGSLGQIKEGPYHGGYDHSATLIRFFFFQNDNIIIMCWWVTLLWMGFVGGLDDYLKVKGKQKGIKGIKLGRPSFVGHYLWERILFYPETVRSNSEFETSPNNTRLQNS